MLLVLVAVVYPHLAAPAQGALITAVASTLAVLAGIITVRTSTKANVTVASTTSRTDIEKDAFTRAEDYYQGVIEDQDRRYQHAMSDLQAARTAAEDANTRAGRCEQAAQHLSEELSSYRMTARRLVRMLAATDLGEQHPEVQEALLAFIADQQVDTQLPPE